MTTKSEIGSSTPDSCEKRLYVATIPQGKSPKPRGVTLSVEWGYETHSVRITAATWADIQRGERRSLTSTGHYEGTKFEIRWSIHKGQQPEVDCSYGEDGADGYIGSLAGATVCPE